MLIQYRLYSDPEYNAKNKAEARAEKTDTLRMRYINENYDAAKKQMMGLPPTPQTPQDLETAVSVKSNYTVSNALTSGSTWIPITAFIAFIIAFSFCSRDSFLLWMQRHSFMIVVLTLSSK